MSADNWTVCPRCEARRLSRLAAEEQRVMALYGKVPVEEFDQQRAALDKEKAQEPKETWREDYEFFGAEDGVLSIRYRGACMEGCGLSYEFKKDEVFFEASDV